MVNPERRYTHGGMLAALVDLAADWAMLKKLGRPVPTIDLRVDYHAAAMPGDLTAKGKVVRQGGQFSCAEASIYDKDGKLAGLRPRHLFHRAPAAAEGVIEIASDAYLHQSRRPDRPRPRPVEDRGRRSRRRGVAARVQLSRARRHGERRRARADQARLRPRRPRRHPLRQPRRISSPPISASCAPASSRCR